MNKILKHIPNTLTILRMAAVPFFILLMVKEEIGAAVIVFIAAEISDVLDGIIARRYNLITQFGKAADPLADKLMQWSALFCLAAKDMIHNVIPWLVLVKDLFLLASGLYIIKSKKKVDVSSKWFGKLTSVLFFIAILSAFFLPRSTTGILFWICVGMALFAAIMYIRNYFKQIKHKPNETIEKGA